VADLGRRSLSDCGMRGKKKKIGGGAVRRSGQRDPGSEKGAQDSAGGGNTWRLRGRCGFRVATSCEKAGKKAEFLRDTARELQKHMENARDGSHSVLK